MPQTHLLSLELPQAEQEQLKRDYRRLFDGLARGEIIDARKLAPLRERMTAAIARSDGWTQLVKEAQTDHRLAHLTHADHELLNLPWRLTAGQAPFLSLSKGQPTDGDLPSGP